MNLRAAASSYENRLVAILTLSFGFTILDRVALTLLSPYILDDLHLDNTALGIMAAALSVTLSLSGYFFGAYSDKARNRKMTLFVAVVAFSLLSSISGLAISLATMVGARLLMGITEGPILPLSYSVIGIESSPHRRGFNQGVFANFATCMIGGVIGPIVLTQVASAYSWRVAFFLTGIPGLIIALLIYKYVREPRLEEIVAAHEAEHQAALAHGPTPGAERNVWLCAILICGLYTWLLVTLTFLPIYLVRVVGMAPTTMGFVSAVNGVSGFTLAIGVSWLADRIGRKPTVILFSLVGLLTPIGALWAHHSLPLMIALMFVGWSAIGISPLFAGTIPSESVPEAKVARTLAIIIGIGEIVGGVIMPTIAGKAADLWGLDAPLEIVLGATALMAVVSCFIKETRPMSKTTATQAAAELAGTAP